MSIPMPFHNEHPSMYSDRLGIVYSKSVASSHKKQNGQFFTPVPITKLMASLSENKNKKVRILDPGCGTAILSCSLVEFLIENNPNLEEIELVTYETDLNLSPYLHKILEYLKEWSSQNGVQLHYISLFSDFILDNARALRKNDDFEKFDIIISNPPYFKLSKTDERTVVASQLVSGQPNIYALFMGIASQLLIENGELIFITPRSFTSGNYFKAFREYFFNAVQLKRIHLFVSRKETFNRDKVLQETLIIKTIKQQIDTNKTVLISSSSGIEDITNPARKNYQYSELLDFNSKEKILHLPVNNEEESILRLVSNWGKKLIDLDIYISTGPVVSFRAWDYIQNHYENGTVFLAPLFWLQNVCKMTLEWPKEIKDKGQYIKILKQSNSLLLPNKNYIFLRRFSTKDDKSRLIASPYFCNYYQSSYIGVENKLNYIYRKNGHLDRTETVGLCAVLNSKLFDAYFQIFNGNVNVSATELREMNFPEIEVITDIGKEIILSNDYSMENVNQIIENTFKLESIDL